MHHRPVDDLVDEDGRRGRRDHGKPALGVQFPVAEPYHDKGHKQAQSPHPRVVRRADIKKKHGPHRVGDAPEAFVEVETKDEAIEVAQTYFTEPRVLMVCTPADADILGYDTY